MKLFQNCPSCGCSIRDKKLLQLLEVFPVICPSCGKKVYPLHLNELEADVIIDVDPEEEITGDTLPTGFKDSLGLGGKK